jgi:hypothetical protein
MMMSRSTVAVSIFASTLGLVAPRLAFAQDADAAEVQRYVLTDAALAKYSQATEALAGLGGDCEEEDEEPQSINQMVAALEAAPGAAAAVRAAGLAPREYVVFSLSLLQNVLASFSASQPGAALPPGILRANVDFVRKHEAALQQLGSFESESCDDE